MELVRGAVVDRPWGLTLASLARRALTGQLTLTAEDGKRYAILFERGAVVNASSPLASDAVARIALTQHLVSSTQVPELVRHLAAANHPDEVEALAKAARLTTDQQVRLRRQVIAQRAARTFSIERGEFIIDDQPTMPRIEGAEVDIRAVIYLGARVNLSETRLTTDLRALGARFTLDPARADDLPYFGFTEGEQAVVDALTRGASVVELIAAHATLAPRTTHAVVYALAACNAVTSAGRTTPETTAPKPSASVPFVNATPRAKGVSLAINDPQAPDLTQRSKAVSLASNDPLTVNFHPPTNAPPTGTIPTPSRTTTEPTAPRTVTDTSPSKRPSGTHAATGTGSQRTVTGPHATVSPPNQPRTTTPPATGRTPTAPSTPRTTTSPPLPRTPTSPAVARTATPRPATPTNNANKLVGEAPVASRTITDPLVARATSDTAAAQDAYRRGEMAMRRDQFALAITEFSRAKELAPKEPDYDAMLAWAKFCEASDKKAIAAETRKILENASRRAEKSVTATFYLGRVERMLGRDKEALAHFHMVLEQQPNHKDAQSEVRVLEARISDRGLFGLKR